MTMRRRNFLTMMAALPLAAKAEGWSYPVAEQVASSHKKNFYLWVHGAFGITWLKPTQADPGPGIQLACPNLASAAGNEHSYRVGRITKRAEKPTGTTEIYKEGKAKKAFKFKGLSAQWTEPKPFEPAIPIRLVGKLKDDYDGYGYRLPYPKAVLPLRTFRVRVEANPPGKLPENEFEFPMVHVFAYQNIDPTHVKIVSAADEHEILWRNTAENHLHLFVEPAEPEHEDGHNPDETLNALVDCYSGIEKFSLKGGEGCLRLDNILGFCADLKEQFHYYEWSTKACQVVPDFLKSRPQSEKSPQREYTFKPQGCPQFWIAEP